MTILVCPLSHVVDVVRTRAPELVISLLDPDFAFPEFGPSYSYRHLKLHLHDIHVPVEGQQLPTSAHVGDLIAFVAEWKRSGPILVHCRAGIGRSPATAYILARLLNPLTDEHRIAIALRRASYLARPNETLIRFADYAMRRNGRMLKAIVDTGRNLPWIFDEIDEGEPFELRSDFQSEGA